MTDLEWPKHPDGRNKKFSELSRDEQRAQIKASCDRLKNDKSFIARLNAAVHDGGSA